MKKKKIIILIICISAFLAIGGFMTYAINVEIEYNYNLTVVYLGMHAIPNA